MKKMAILALTFLFCFAGTYSTSQKKDTPVVRPVDTFSAKKIIEKNYEVIEKLKAVNDSAVESSPVVPVSKQWTVMFDLKRQFLSYMRKVKSEKDKPPHIVYKPREIDTVFVDRGNNIIPPDEVKTEKKEKKPGLFNRIWRWIF